MNRTLFVTAIAVGLGLCPMAKATTWSFLTPTSCSPSPCSSTDFGTSATYTIGPPTITAYGFNVGNTGGVLPAGANLIQGTARHLDPKNIVPTDVGLGLLTGVANEIDRTGYVEFDMSALATGLGRDVSFALSSLAGDSYDVYDGASLSPVGGLTLLSAGNTTSPFPTAPLTFHVDGSHDYFAFIAHLTGQSVLVTSVTATPEPRFYGLLLVGLFGLGMVFQRRAGRKNSIHQPPAPGERCRVM